MNRIEMLQSTASAVAAGPVVDVDDDRLAALLLAIATASDVAEASPAHADAWDFCAVELHEALDLLAPTVDQIAAATPHELPPLTATDREASDAVRLLLVSLAIGYAGAALDPAGPASDVAAAIHRAAAALP